MTNNNTWLNEIKWNTESLVPVVVQDFQSSDVLMHAWMNHESLLLTVTEGAAVYWSRSRNRLWRKGEESGHQQIIKDIRLDCDADTLLIKVEQIGGIACHTGRKQCFYRRLEHDRWHIVEAVIKDPSTIYKK